MEDVWKNIFNASGGSFLGYREDLEEFPHDLYSFIQSSIRELDAKETRLLYRFLQQPQIEWESIYGKILNLPNLYSPEKCPAEYLDYLGYNIGITDDLYYLWGVLTENEKRRLIRYFVRFLVMRSTRAGVIESIRAMTGQQVIPLTYFHFRWLLSGDEETSDLETALGREDQGWDPWLLTQYYAPVSVKPDAVTIYVDPGSGAHTYAFTMTTFLAQLENPPAPLRLRMSYRPTGQSVIGTRFFFSQEWLLVGPPDYFFGQAAAPYSTDLEDFRISIDPDEYTTDIRIIDDGTLHREMVCALAKFMRPNSERYFIRYYSFIDKLTRFNQWATDQGTTFYDSEDKTVLLSDGTEDTIMTISDPLSEDWENYCVSVIAMVNEPELAFEIHFYKQADDDYLFFRTIFATPPTIPVGTWEMGEVVGGSETVWDSGNLIQADCLVNYYWRVVCVEDSGDIFVQVFQDECLVCDTSAAKPWVDSHGTVSIFAEEDNGVLVSYVDVHPFPLESDYIGP